MKTFLTTHLLMSMHLLIIAVTISLGAWFAHHEKEVVVREIQDTIERQDALMLGFAETTDNNGADSVTESIISDCGRRNEFELMLNKLSTLTYKDLLTVQQLFASCGNFYAERKALMVFRLEREFMVLKDTTELLEILTEQSVESERINVWERLIALEKDRSAFLTEQTQIQEDIIISLIAGKGVTSSTVKEYVARAQELNELLNGLNQQIDELRNSLKT